MKKKRKILAASIMMLLIFMTNCASSTRITKMVDNKAFPQGEVLCISNLLGEKIYKYDTRDIRSELIEDSMSGDYISVFNEVNKKQTTIWLRDFVGMVCTYKQYRTFSKVILINDSGVFIKEIKRGGSKF